jgi:pimeloyl-ACP methyl ester carboxylesterase
VHFALVHGAYHGAWCWDHLRRELERGGHETSAADLPCEDPDAGVERYAEEVVESIPRSAQDIVLVGHSLGGLTIPVVASRTRALMTVYLCALVPVPGLSFDGQNADAHPGFQPSAPAIGHPDGSASWPEAGAVEVFYHDCEPLVAAEAAKRLRRQYWRPTQEVTPLREWPKVRSVSILCEADRMIAPAYVRRAARDLLHIDAIEMPGGHSPFLARPAELAAVLVRESISAQEAARPDAPKREIGWKPA